MSSKNDQNFIAFCDELRAYVEEYHLFPDKHRIENRGLLCWWKYQMKKKKAGTLTEKQVEMLQRLADSQSTEHIGGRRKITKVAELNVKCTD